MLGQQGTWVCSLDRCCHRLYLTPIDHEEVFAAKNWEYMNLGQLWELSEEQILVWCQRQGTFIWKRSRVGCGGGWQVRRKEAREGNMCFNMKPSFLKWIWKAGRGWLQVLSLEGKRTGQWLLCIFYWFQLQNRWMEWSPMAQTLGRTGV